MKERAYYHICPCCGANLDPGERCDCEEPNDNDEVSQKDVA